MTLVVETVAISAKNMMPCKWKARIVETNERHPYSATLLNRTKVGQVSRAVVS